MSIQDADVADVESCSRKPSRPVVRKLRLDPLRVKLNEFGHERCPPWSGLLIASSGISFFSAGSRKVYRSWGRLQAPKTFGPKKPASAAEKPGDVQSRASTAPSRPLEPNFANTYRCSRNRSGQSTLEPFRTTVFNTKAATHSIKITYFRSISTDFNKSSNLVRDQGVGGSNPLSPTNTFNNLQPLYPD